MNDNSHQQSSPQVVRVDLTSQDLRTGTIRLPRQLHGHFSEGDLAAEDLLDSDVHLLTVQPPRDLQGLAEFMEKHDLQTNDAVVMHVDGQELKLEPFYRRPRAQPQDDEPQVPASETFHEHVSEGEDAELEAESGAPEAAQEPPHHGAEPESALTEGAQPSAATAQAEPDPFDSFADYDDYGDYDQDDGTDFQAGPGEPAEAPDGTEDPEPEAPAEEPPHRQLETPQEAISTSEHLEPDPFHTTARRPFTLPTGPLAVRRPASFAQQFAERKDTPKAQAPQARPEPAAPAPEPTAPMPTDSHSLVQNYLNTPGLPSILNAADLAGRLNMDKDELIDILGKLAGQPNSRLSTVRPGFYLLKRADND